jgi:hypothetical protein
MDRLNSTVPSDFFSRYVYRYHDKQYQTYLGKNFVEVGIDYQYDRELLDNLSAAIISRYADMSYATALKYRKGTRRDNGIPHFERLFDLVESTFLTTTEHFLTNERPDLSDDHSLLVNAEVFLLRVPASLNAARYLINWGFFQEPLTLLRSTLEQLAWCYRVGTRFDTQQVDRPEPTKCISDLGTIFPAAGPLYGALTAFSHMQFEAQTHFLTSTNSNPGMMQRSIEFKFFGLLFYAFVLIATQYVCREFSKFYQNNYNCKYNLRNAVLPLKLLMSHALDRPELKNDYIASTITKLYLALFNNRAPDKFENILRGRNR